MDGSPVGLWIKIFGDSEVNDHRASTSINQDVARLQVAVHDAVIVDLLDGIQNSLSNAKPIHKTKSVGIAPLVQGFTIDVFHDEIWAAVFRGPTINPSCDVGVRQ